MKRKLTTLELKELLLTGSKAEIAEIIDTIHPVDVLDILHNDEDNALKILNRLPDELIADIVEEEDDEDKYELLSQFSDTKQRHILDEMSQDEVTDLIGELDETEVGLVLNKMSRKDQEEVKKLLTFNPDSAGGIMTTEFLSINANSTILETLKFLQKNTDNETPYYLYVTDKSHTLKGVVALRDIVSSSFDTKVIDITNPNVHSINVLTDQEDVAHKFEKYGFVMMPVTDDDNHMLGVITVDDIINIIQEENTEDIHRLAGINKEEHVDSSIAQSVKSRLPWLVVNLFTAILAAAVVSSFEGTIAKVVTLATIMPIITGMGGNAGTQSMTLIVRAMSLGEISKDNAKPILIKEIVVGFINGLIVGLIISILAYLFVGNIAIGLLTGIAMWANMLMANAAGYFIPVVLKKLHVDPALASTVFVTTVTDVLGFFFFLGLATLMLPYII
ncbi:MAG: magnesium transporter [Erysipelotrichaceae bacterium]